MQDELALYPPELPTDVASILADAHTLDVRRLGRGSRVVHRVNLTNGENAVAHGSRTDRSDDDVAAEVWGAALEDANKFCKGQASYRITATYAKPPRGANAASESIELRVGDDVRSDAQLKGEWTSMMLAERSQLFKHYIELMTGSTRVVASVSTMMVGLSEALARVTERERDIAADATVQLEMRQAAAADRERMKLLEKFGVPALQMFRQKMGLPPAAVAKPSAAAAVADASSSTPATPAIVITARKLGASLTAEQLEHASTAFGDPRLAELATIEGEAELLDLYTWLSEQDMSALMSMSANLSEAQQPLMDALHTWGDAKAEDVRRARELEELA